MNLNLPENIKKLIAGQEYSVNEIGMSGAAIWCFDDRVLKIEKTSEESNNEAAMLMWLKNRLPVPEVLCFEAHNGFNYLLMSRVRGRMSCETGFTAGEVIPALAEGLLMLWAVDLGGCPYVNDSGNKLNIIERRAALGRLGGASGAEPETYGKHGFSSPEALFSWLKEHKPAEEKLVFSHGDYCLPNIFIENGRPSGFIDMGRAGAADKWQDIALCVRSLCHNFGENPEYGEQLLKRLGISPEPEKMKYYLLMDELF